MTQNALVNVSNGRLELEFGIFFMGRSLAWSLDRSLAQTLTRSLQRNRARKANRTGHVKSNQKVNSNQDRLPQLGSVTSGWQDQARSTCDFDFCGCILLLAEGWIREHYSPQKPQSPCTLQDSNAHMSAQAMYAFVFRNHVRTESVNTSCQGTVKVHELPTFQVSRSINLNVLVTRLQTHNTICKKRFTKRTTWDHEARWQETRRRPS